PPPCSFLFSFSLHGCPPHLHSFPTRRSSDLDALRDQALRPIALQALCRIGREAVVVAAPAMLEAAREPDERWAVLSAVIQVGGADRKSTRLNSSHVAISYAVFCLKKKDITK